MDHNPWQHIDLLLMCMYIYMHPAYSLPVLYFKSKVVLCLDRHHKTDLADQLLMTGTLPAAGYAFARGECTKHSNPIIGLSNFFSINGGATDDDPLYWALWMFSWVFAAVSVTIPSGALAERCQLRAYLVYSFWQTGLIYPLVVHWVWSHEVQIPLEHN